MQKVYVNFLDNYTDIAVQKEDVLEWFYHIENNFLTGSIFVGKVKFVKKQIGVFVDVGMERDGILAFREGLKAGDYILVQVVKEPTIDKGCALTEKLTIAGRYAVLNDVGEYKFSRKLSEKTKSELFKLEPKNDVGFIYRSACENTDVLTIKNELEQLYNKYKEILSSSKNVNNVKRLYQDTPIDVAKRFAYSDDDVIIGFSEIENEIKEIGARKIYKKGVELVFDKTEAMTVVDINVHQYKSDFSDVDTTNYNANVIAIKELARQIRLRNLGGIIMVDFISLRQKEYVEKLTTILIEELSKDNVKTKVEVVESIGCFAIVRTRRYSAL